jgi:DnaJ-class molecular chaperone
MLYENDVALVEKAVMLGFRDQDSCNAWERIKKELGERSKTVRAKRQCNKAREKICPECNGSGFSKFVNQTNCTLCKGHGKLRHT